MDTAKKLLNLPLFGFLLAKFLNKAGVAGQRAEYKDMYYQGILL
jgi:hypothetical protein